MTEPKDVKPSAWIATECKEYDWEAEAIAKELLRSRDDEPVAQRLGELHVKLNAAIRYLDEQHAASRGEPELKCEHGVPVGLACRICGENSVQRTSAYGVALGAQIADLITGYCSLHSRLEPCGECADPEPRCTCEVREDANPVCSPGCPHSEWMNRQHSAPVAAPPAQPAAVEPQPFEPMACCGRERDKDGGPNPHCECPAPLKPKAAESATGEVKDCGKQCQCAVCMPWWPRNTVAVAESYREQLQAALERNRSQENKASELVGAAKEVAAAWRRGDATSNSSYLGILETELNRYLGREPGAVFVSRAGEPPAEPAVPVAGEPPEWLRIAHREAVTSLNTALHERDTARAQVAELQGSLRSFAKTCDDLETARDDAGAALSAANARIEELLLERDSARMVVDRTRFELGVHDGESAIVAIRALKGLPVVTASGVSPTVPETGAPSGAVATAPARAESLQSECSSLRQELTQERAHSTAMRARVEELTKERDAIASDERAAVLKAKVYGELAYKWRKRCIDAGLANAEDRILADEWQARGEALTAANTRIEELKAALERAHDKNAALRSAPELEHLRGELAASTVHLANSELARQTVVTSLVNERDAALVRVGELEVENKELTLSDKDRRWREVALCKSVFASIRAGASLGLDLDEAIHTAEISFGVDVSAEATHVPVATGTQTCQWYTIPDLVTGEGTSEACNDPATWRGCDGFTCEKHKCRCAKPVATEREPAATNMWFYAPTCDAEDWNGPHDSIEDTLEAARSDYTGAIHEFWVDEAHPVDWDQALRRFVDADDLLDRFAEYVGDNEHIEDPEPEFRVNKEAAQEALERWAVEHLSMRDYWQCIGKAVVYPVTPPVTPKPIPNIAHGSGADPELVAEVADALRGVGIEPVVEQMVDLPEPGSERST